MCCSPSSPVCQVCGKDDVGMCGARYDVAALSAVVSEPLHKQLVCVMVRDPLSPVYENKQTVKGFTCSETTAKWSVEQGEAQALQQCPHPPTNPASSISIAASLAARSSSLNH